MAVGTYALTTLTKLKAYLGVGDTDDDTLLENLIDRATAFCESYCDRKIRERDFYEWHDGTNDRRIRVDNWPISRIYQVSSGVANALSVSATDSTDLSNSVSLVNDSLLLNRFASDGTESRSAFDLTNSSYNTTSKLATHITSATGWSGSSVENIPSRKLHTFAGIEVSATTYTLTYPSQDEKVHRVEYDTGMVYLRTNPHWPNDAFLVDNQVAIRQSVLVYYQGGFTTTPDDVEQACIEVAASFYHKREHDSNVASESLGDYSYSLRPPQDVLDSIHRILEPYKNVR